MKTINEDTTLRCKDKIFKSVKVDGVNFWVDKEATIFTGMYRIDGGADTGENPIDKHCGENYTPRLSMHPKYPYWLIVAQSEPKLEGVPVISLDSYVERLKKGISEFSKLATDTQEQFWTGKAAGFGEALQVYNKSNPNQYTQKDIEKAMNAARNIEVNIDRTLKYTFSNETILEAINSISVIEVDEQFNILSYE